MNNKSYKYQNSFYVIPMINDDSLVLDHQRTFKCSFTGVYEKKSTFYAQSVVKVFDCILNVKSSAKN